MTETTTFDTAETPIATIQNSRNPDQEVEIFYVREEGAFVTRGIGTHFGLQEILVPAQYMVVEFDLFGAILSAVLEKISAAHDHDSTFAYEPRFEVMGRMFSFTDHGPYVRLQEEERSGALQQPPY